MQKLIQAVSILAFASQAQASMDLTVQDVYSRIESNLITTFPQKPKAKEPYYQAWLKSENSQQNRSISAFPNANGVVKQIRFEVYVCDTHKRPYSEGSLMKEFAQFVADQSKAVLLSTIAVGEADMSKLRGKNDVTLTIKPPTNGIQRMRVSRGFYKCDSTGGYGYRLDAFLGGS